MYNGLVKHLYEQWEQRDSVGQEKKQKRAYIYVI